MKDEKTYKYSLISKYKFSFLALLLPLFLVTAQIVASIIGIEMGGFVQTESHNGSIELQIACLLFFLYSMYLDWNNRGLFFDISITENGLDIAGYDRSISWEGILRVEKFGRLTGRFNIKDKDYNKAGGVPGVRVILTDTSKMVIYESISEYSELLAVIETNLET